MPIVQGLSVLLDNLIQLQVQYKRNYGIIARDAAIGAGVSTLGTGALLAGTGALLRGKAPALGHMLTNASKQHYKLFNPKYSIPMLKSLPEASGLFGKQMRLIKQAEKFATSEAPNLSSVKTAIRSSGVSPEKDVKELRGFMKKYGRSPSATMESSVGLLSGSASTAVGAAGGLATSSGWKKKTQPQSVEELSDILDDLIEFRQEPIEFQISRSGRRILKDGTRIDVKALNHLVQDRVANRIKIKNLAPMPYTRASGYSEARVNRSNPQKPILRYGREVIDGRHRITRKQRLGHTTVSAIMVTAKDLKAVAMN